MVMPSPVADGLPWPGPPFIAIWIWLANRAKVRAETLPGRSSHGEARPDATVHPQRILIQMLLLIIGLVVFLGIHLLPTSPDLRDGLVRRFGENTYKAIFSIASLIGFVIIVLGYHKMQINPGKNVILWESPAWMTHVAWALMLPAMIFLVAAYIPSRIRTALKHPMLAAIKLWALAHLLVNGDLASLALFGSFLAFAIYDRISVKRRGALGPLGAKTGGLAGDIAVLVIGVALHAFMMHFGHGWLIGVPLLPA